MRTCTTTTRGTGPERLEAMAESSWELPIRSTEMPPRAIANQKVLQHNVHILIIAQLLTWAGTVWLSRNLLTDFLKVGKPAALWSNSFELLETFSQWISTTSKEYRWRSLAKVTTILFEIPKSLHIRHLLYIYINLKNDRNTVSVLLWIHSPLISTEVTSTWAARLIFLAYACWSEDIVTPQSIHHPQGPIGMFPLVAHVSIHTFPSNRLACDLCTLTGQVIGETLGTTNEIRSFDDVDARHNRK